MEIVGRRIINQAFKERGNRDVILWDVLPVENGETIFIYFESKNSEWAQGIWLMCDQGVEIGGERGKSAVLWYESAPTPAMLKCHTSQGLLNVYNIWDRGYGRNSLMYSSGMLVEELPNGRRYRCNDIGFKTNFDKLIFRIERINTQT